MKDNFIMTIGNINFFNGGKFWNNSQMIYTEINSKYDENYHVPLNSNLIKECQRLYKLWYEN